ncbi:MAG TPA: DUF2089 domain-containing protein [Fimbriimonadaceae bacterium]|nr:DUF2089 domain-containing protein [Fimbriimonadaceae bacterium]
MSEEKYLRIPSKDPVDGADLFVSELTGEHSGISIRGRFAIPRYAKLDDEQAHFLETFLRCRGMLNSVEKELGLSYPTVRSRLDSLLDALGLEPVKERGSDGRKERALEKKRKVLDLLEQGEISAEEAKLRMKSEEEA